MTMAQTKLIPSEKQLRFWIENLVYFFIRSFFLNHDD